MKKFFWVQNALNDFCIIGIILDNILKTKSERGEINLTKSRPF